jgi:hypothetical protein
MARPCGNKDGHSVKLPVGLFVPEVTGKIGTRITGSASYFHRVGLYNQTELPSASVHPCLLSLALA